VQLAAEDGAPSSRRGRAAAAAATDVSDDTSSVSSHHRHHRHADAGHKGGRITDRRGASQQRSASGGPRRDVDAALMRLDSGSSDDDALYALPRRR
jgi:hypothetical protein